MTMEIYQILASHREKPDIYKAIAIRDLILKDLVLDEYGRWRDTEHFAAAGACANMVVKLMGITNYEPTKVSAVDAGKA